MAGKVTSMSVKVAAAAVAEGQLVVGSGRGELNVSGLCAAHGVSRKTFYKWVDRYRAEGVAGLEDRSRRPLTHPTQTPAAVEDLVVRVRKELADGGLDHGPTTILWHLGRRQQRGELDGVRLPSAATLWRILVRRGLVTPEPRKRPKSSIVRFEAPAPNEWWQIDAMDWVTASGPAKVFNIVDDHSRVAARSRAVGAATSEQAWTTFGQAAAVWGLPAGVLSDNGLCFSGKLRGVEVLFEARLRDAGIRPMTGRPYHPQTTGKVERFQQTVKKWLRKQPLAADLAELQAQLDRFTHIYNTQRPHQGISGAIPLDRWTATPVGGPAAGPLAHPDYGAKTHHSTVHHGCVQADTFKIHIGAEYNGLTATVVVDTQRANVFIDDNLIRHLELDHTRSYQPSGRPRGGPRRPRLRS
ncbi:MAG TPA: IS481 family transposase [Acidimicrobiales bacterium]|nr:IS481 family transposase [Acidimicrobiales bacterium]